MVADPKPDLASNFIPNPAPNTVLTLTPESAINWFSLRRRSIATNLEAGFIGPSLLGLRGVLSISLLTPTLLVSSHRVTRSACSSSWTPPPS
jgi:hypothetical protein